MLKSFKAEIKPTPEQALTIRRTIGTCRYVYNLFVATNQRCHESNEPFMGGTKFSVWLNHELLPVNPDKAWRAVKQSVMNADAAFKRFFKEEAGFLPVSKRKAART